jgi:hypothetical protein
MRKPNPVSTGVLASWLVTLAAPAFAQAPQVSHVFPPGVRRGAAATVILMGENLKPESRILVSGEGIAAAVVAPPSVGSSEQAAAGDKKPAEAGKALSVRLEVAPDAAPGVRELRVLGPNGASNAARVAVGLRPDMVETEPNDKTEKAQALLELPATVYGRIESLGDEDTFRFRAAAGETWVFDLGSASHGSTLDGFLVLQDAKGRNVATLMEALEQDPRLIYSFKEGGDYTITVRDVTYRGSQQSTYRLSIGRLPAVTRVLPLGVPRGQTTTVQLAGVNLGGMVTMDVTVPADYAGSTLTVVPKTPAGEATPMHLAVTSLPEAVEAEPNNDRERATRLPGFPAAISGVIGQEGDADFYAFPASSGQKLTFEIHARRLGTRMDSFLRVLDKDGKELANNDDAAGKDSRLVWSPPANGDYYLQVTDLVGFGGDAYGYRLEVTAAAEPDFRLSVTPDGVNMGQGGTDVVTVRAERRNEFTGDIALRVEDLPPGVTASPGTIRTGQDTLQITLTSTTEAARQGFPIRVVGTATVEGKPVERTAEPRESYQPTGGGGQRERAVAFHVVGIGERVPYSLVVAPGQVSLSPGATATLTVKAIRRPDAEEAKGELNMEVQNLPEGVTANAPAIPADKSEGTIELKASEKLDPRSVNLIIRGRIKENRQVAPAVTLMVIPKPAEAPAK